jgi:hypothetical protein
MSLKRNLLIGGAGFAAFIVASSLAAVLNSVVSALVPGRSSDPPGQMEESLEEKAQRETAEQKAKDDAEKEKQESPSKTTPEPSTPESSSTSESKTESEVQPASPPPPPPVPTPGPGNLGYEPPQYTSSGAGGPGNLN